MQNAREMLRIAFGRLFMIDNRGPLVKTLRSWVLLRMVVITCYAVVVVNQPV